MEVLFELRSEIPNIVDSEFDTIAEYGEWDQPKPEKESRIVDPHDMWLKEFIVRGEGIGEYDIFTDGSFDKELQPVAFLLDHEVKTISEAAIVIAGTEGDWENGSILALRIQNDERVSVTSAFPLELRAPRQEENSHGLQGSSQTDQLT